MRNQKEDRNGLRWRGPPSPASFFEQALEILPSSAHQRLTVDSPEPTQAQVAMRANTEQQQHVSVPNTQRPKLSVVEANTEQRTPKDRTRRANNTESEKGAFVRNCLTETPNIRNTDIQRKANEQGITISPAYISELRKALSREQTA